METQKSKRKQERKKERRSLNGVVKLLYPSNNYTEYCEHQKRKGLMRKYWKDLPNMWRNELKFRRELEGALNDFAA
jgi:hypothetical protein